VFLPPELFNEISNERTFGMPQDETWPDLIGQFIPNVRALRGILAAAGSQGEEYAQISDNIRNSQGLLNEAFERTTQTAGFKVSRALASLGTAGVKLGSVMLIGSISSGIEECRSREYRHTSQASASRGSYPI